MSQFNVNDISRYRTQLMGIATLLVIFGHSVGNGVVMPRWMESLCGLASVGVDIFLLVSGLGLWYSLKSIDNEAFILEKINERSEAKKNKDFEKADKIREELLSMGIVLKDTREGTTYEAI